MFLATNSTLFLLLAIWKVLKVLKFQTAEQLLPKFASITLYHNYWSSAFQPQTHTLFLFPCDWIELHQLPSLTGLVDKKNNMMDLTI